MQLSKKTLDPDERQPFGMDVSARLSDGETIASYVFADVTNVTVAQHSQDSGIITVVLTGAISPEARITARVTTSLGYVFDATLRVRVTSH